MSTETVRLHGSSRTHTHDEELDLRLVQPDDRDPYVILTSRDATINMRVGHIQGNGYKIVSEVDHRGEATWFVPLALVPQLIEDLTDALMETERVEARKVAS